MRLAEAKSSDELLGGGFWGRHDFASQRVMFAQRNATRTKAHHQKVIEARVDSISDVSRKSSMKCLQHISVTNEAPPFENMD